MTTSADYLADARLVADAILYEGYLLYPYRSSAGKNQSRFQFGVLMPAGYRAVDDCEPSASQTECLLECPVDAEVTVAVRFLHLQRRAAEEADGAGGFRPVASLQVAASSQVVTSEPPTCRDATGRKPPAPSASSAVRRCRCRNLTATVTSASAGHSSRHSVWLADGSQSSTAR